MKTTNIEKAADIIVSETARNLIPNPGNSEVAVAAPGVGEGFWIGAPSAVYHDGYFYMAYRVRQPIALGRGQGNVIAKSKDGVHFDIVKTIGKDEMDAESLERPALVRTPGGIWRLYISCATKGTKHWRVELLEAKDPAELDAKTRKVVMPGDEHWGVKDPVIVWQDGKWHTWTTFHPLDVADHEDRMVSNYATSDNGVDWDWHGTAIRGREGLWDSRGARVTAAVFHENEVIAFYDGRATAGENYEERTGLAVGNSPDAFEAVGDEPVAQSADGKGLRYLCVVPLDDGRSRLYYELSRHDGSHELRTELI